MQNNLKHLTLGLLLTVISICSVYAQTDGDYYQMARAEGKKNNFAKAATFCIEGLKKTPNDMDLKEYLGKCYLETGKLDQARLTLLDVLRRSPDRDDARRYLVTIESLTNRKASAICYVNELLETNPYDKELWLKKVTLYKDLHNNVEAEKSISRLLQIFPNDENVRKTYNSIVKESASILVKKENLEEAALQYQNALITSKNDPEMFMNLINTQIKLGEYNEALNTSNKALFFMPTSAEFTGKKASILEAQGNYTQAIAAIEQTLKRQNSPQLRRQLDYLIAESARNQVSNDPYVLYAKIYEKNKGDQEALRYLINTAIERNKYEDAQQWLDAALRSNPNNKELLLKQILVYERTQNKKAELLYDRLNQLYPNDKDIAAKFFELKFNQAKTDFQNQEYGKAIEGFLLSAQHPEFRIYAQENLFNCYVAAKNNLLAQQTIDKLLKEAPNNEKYSLLKLNLLTQNGDYEQALVLAKEIHKKFPQSTLFPEELDLLAGKYIKSLMANENYAAVVEVSDYVIDVDPSKLQPYLYGLNARVAQNKYEEAQGYIQHALTQFPNHKDLRLKMAGIYSSMDEHMKAAAVLSELRQQYPYNDTIANSWVEEMFLAAKQLESQNDLDAAVATYQQIIQDRPKDIHTSIKLLSILTQLQRNEQAMQLVDQCLQHNPNQNELIFQKAVIYENTGSYDDALQYYEKYEPTADKRQQLKDHLLYLRAKRYRNMMTASFTNIKSDSLLLSTPVASLEYMHQPNAQNTVVARVNYAGRNSGVGIQGELEWYHTFQNKSGIMLSAGLANQFFQKYKAAASYFQPLPQDWQLEIGGRYARLNNDANFYTAVLGLEKTFNSVWISGKGLYMNDGTESYYNALLQSRFYLLNERDYFTAMAGIGNAPEDQRLDFQLNNLLSYANSMVGAGYKHHIGYKSAIGILGNWYSYKMSNTVFINQYNVNITFSTKF